MLELLYIIPCEQMLTAESGAASLISVLERVLVSGETAATLPTNAGLPKAWTGVVLWRRIEEIAEPTHYNCKIELIGPDGKSAVGGIVNFTVSNGHRNYRNNINFPIFPIGQQGYYNLTVSLKRDDEDVFEEKGVFPIIVSHEIRVVNESQNDQIEEVRQSVESV